MNYNAKGRVYPPALARFEANVIPEPNSGCHLWTASVSPRGYGKFYIAGRHLRANRAAWELYVGSIPDGLRVLHRCDTPACVNPDHLWLGTDADNQRDKVRKGRHPEQVRFNRGVCLHGHDLTNPSNVSRDTRGHRRCAICGRRRRSFAQHPVSSSTNDVTS